MPQLGDQPRRLELAPVIAPVARLWVDRSRLEHADLVVVTQGHHRQAGEHRERADRDEVVHAEDSGVSGGRRVKPSSSEREHEVEHDRQQERAEQHRLPREDDPNPPIVVAVRRPGAWRSCRAPAPCPAPAPGKSRMATLIAIVERHRQHQRGHDPVHATSVAAASVELEHLAQPTLLLLLVRLLGVLLVLLVRTRIGRHRLTSSPTAIVVIVVVPVVRPFEDLVELAPVEPHAAALRAVVDLDALAFRDRQRARVTPDTS